MRRSITKPQFDKDVRRIKRRSKDIEKLIAVVFLLEKDGRLAYRFRSHKLSGEYEGCWECHLEYMIGYSYTKSKMKRSFFFAPAPMLIFLNNITPSSPASSKSHPAGSMAEPRIS